MRKFAAALVAIGAMVPIALTGPQNAGATGGPTLTPIAHVAFNPTWNNGAAYDAFLPDGHMLVDETSEGVIYEMNADGSAQTIFASGLTNPQGLAVSSAGYVFVATGTGVVRFDADGTNEQTYTTDSTTHVTIAKPHALAVDAAGDVFVADHTSSAVGAVEELTFAKDGSLSAINVVGGDYTNDAPYAITIDPHDGSVYVAGLYSIEVLSHDLTTRSFFAQALYTNFLAVQGDHLIVGDDYDGQPYNPQLETVALPSSSSPVGTRAVAASLGEGAYWSAAVVPATAVGVSAGDVMLGEIADVVDPNQNKLVGQAEIVHVDADLVSDPWIAASGGGPSATRFASMAYDATNGRIYAVDEWRGAVVSMEPDGTDQHTMVAGYDVASYDFPIYVAVDPATGNIYVSSIRPGGNRVEEFPSTGGTESSGTVLTDSSLPSAPTGIAVFGSKLLVASGTAIYEGHLDGTLMAVWHTFSSSQYVNGLTAGTDGSLYAAVGDSASNPEVAQMSTDGTVTHDLSLAGLPKLADPLQAAVDSSGRVFVADVYNGLDEISTSGGGAVAIDGSLANYRGVTSDGAGDVLLGDSGTIDQLGIPGAPSVTSLSRHGVAAGAAGVNLTVTGSNLSGATRVNFVQGTTVTAYGFPLTPSTATTVTIRVPQFGLPAGAYRIQVLTPGGSSSVGGTNPADGFTVDGAKPTITSISPSVGLPAGGTSVVITGTHLAGVTAAAVGGVAAASLSVTDDTHVTISTPPHAASTQNVTLSDSLGTATALNAFTYLGVPTITSLSSTEGPATGGAKLVIKGTNLANATSVSFGGTIVNAASFLSDSATKLSLSIPAGTGTVAVSVTTPGGTSTQNPQYTYDQPPTITTLSPSVGTVKGGTVVVITGTNLPHTSSVTFGGVAATIKKDTATTLKVTTPAHKNTKSLEKVTVQITTPGGTTSKNKAFSYAK